MYRPTRYSPGGHPLVGREYQKLPLVCAPPMVSVASSRVVLGSVTPVFSASHTDLITVPAGTPASVKST
ncbi:MAG: hypothetical protein QN120_15190 [Armatimonadota bacterium]|nr:hypothetical protein [Armatimonadota bacterium]